MMFGGIIISLLITEATGFSPGGIVVAGYLAFFLDNPAWLAGTLAAALVTFGVGRLLETRLLLYGRRQFALYLLTGMLVGQGAMLLSRGGAIFDTGLLVIGYLVPGLIARDFARQGVGVTLLVLALAVSLTRLAVLAGEGWLW
jgi:gamma-polyglutamate biosynthesis protein CapC